MKDIRATKQEWKQFFKSKLGKELVAGIESIRDAKIGKAMGSADMPLPNDAIVANISQAKGIEEVLTYLRAMQIKSNEAQGDEMERGI